MTSHTQNYIFLFLIIGVLTFLLFQKPQTVVKTEPIIGAFKPAIPLSQKPVGTPLTVLWKTDTKYIRVQSEGRVNDSLIKKYTDSITTLEERLQMFVDLSTYRNFSYTFDNEQLTARVEGVSLGYLEELSMPYFKIKSQEVKVPQSKMITFGAQAGYGMTFYGPSPYVGVGVNVDFEQAIRKLLKR